MPIGAAVSLGNLPTSATLEVLGSGTSQHGGTSSTPDLLIGVQSGQQLFVEHNLYGFHVAILSTYLPWIKEILLFRARTPVNMPHRNLMP